MVSSVLDQLPGLDCDLSEGSQKSASRRRHQESREEFHKRVKRWIESCEEGGYVKAGEEYTQLVDSDSVDDEEPTMPGLIEYRNLIQDHKAYEMLLNEAHNISSLDGLGRTTLKRIATEVLGYLPPTNRVSRYRSYDSVNVSFHVSWSVLKFLRDQQYSQSNSEALASAVTLTGTSIDAQALSCKQYVSKVWPHVGEVLLSTVINAMCCGKKVPGE